MPGGLDPSEYEDWTPSKKSIGLWVLLPYFAILFLAFIINIMYRPCKDCKNIRVITGNPAAFCSTHEASNKRTENLKKNRVTPYPMENRELPGRSSQDPEMHHSILSQILSSPPVLAPVSSDTTGGKVSLTIDPDAWIRRFNETNSADQPERDEMELQPVGGRDLPDLIRPSGVHSAFGCVPPSSTSEMSGRSVSQGNLPFVPPSNRTQQNDYFNANLDMPRMGDDASMSTNKVHETCLSKVTNVLTEVATKLNQETQEGKKKMTCIPQTRNLNVLVEKIEYEDEEEDDVSELEISIVYSSDDDEIQEGTTEVRRRTANNSRLGTNENVSPALSVEEPMMDDVTDYMKHLLIQPSGVDDSRAKQDIERLSGPVLEGSVCQITPAKTHTPNKSSPCKKFVPIDMEFGDSPNKAASNIATASGTSVQPSSSSPATHFKTSMDWDGNLDDKPSQTSTSGRSNTSMPTLFMPPCGLVNVHGASCYVNAGLQLLATVPQFERALLHAVRLVPPHSAPATTALVKFLEDRRYSDVIAPMGILDYIFGKHSDKFVAGVQADSEEFVYTLLLDIHNELYRTLCSPVESLFRGQQVVETRSRDGRYTVKASMFQTLVLSVLQHCTLEQCFENYTTEHGNEGCSARTRVLLSKLPPLLLLTLQSYDSSGRKTYNKINLGDTINIRTEWMTAELARSSVAPRYRMRSVIFHTGVDTVSGHYTAAVCQTPSPEQVVWHYCDDSMVTQTDFVTMENVYTMNHPQLVLLERINH